MFAVLTHTQIKINLVRLAVGASSTASSKRRCQTACRTIPPSSDSDGRAGEREAVGGLVETSARDITVPMNTQPTDRTRRERKQRYEHVLGIVENNTVHRQPAFIAQHRVGTVANFGPEMFDDLGSVLNAAVGNKDLLRVKRRDGNGRLERLYAYARDADHLRAVLGELDSWASTPDGIREWCADRIAELEAE